MSKDPFMQLAENVQADEGNVVKSATKQLVDSQLDRIQGTVEQAITDGYDGVDVHFNHVNRDREIDPENTSVKRIVAWNRPAPEIDGQYRIIRFSWEWFDNSLLQRAVENGAMDRVYQMLIRE